MCIFSWSYIWLLLQLIQILWLTFLYKIWLLFQGSGLKCQASLLTAQNHISATHTKHFLSFSHKQAVLLSPAVSLHKRQLGYLSGCGGHSNNGQRRYINKRRDSRLSGFRINSELSISSAVDVINDLGFDTLTFLGVTVVIVPAFRIIKASPVSVWGLHYVYLSNTCH